MAYSPYDPSELLFSTFTTLPNVDDTYTSGVVSLENWTQVQTDILSDTDGEITIEFIRDAGGTDVLRTLVIPYVGGSGYQMFSAPAFTPFVKYTYRSTEAGQTDFWFDTKATSTALSPQILGVDAFISPLMVSNLNRSVIVGKTSGGQYNNVAIEPVTNKLEVSVPRTSFGELEVNQPTPVVQQDFVYNINTDTVDTTTTGSATVSQVSSMAVLNTGGTPGSAATLETKRYLKYRPGQGAHARGTAIFNSPWTGTTQLWGIGNSVDGFFFGYNGTDFGVLHRNNSIDTWYLQTAWNGDTMDGTGPSGRNLIHTNGNVYQIKFQWLGFGQITFGIEDETTGRFLPVHTIDYANTSTTPSLTNPSLPIMWHVDNAGTTNNLTLRGASCSAEVEGEIRFLGPTKAIGNSKIGVGTTLTNILTIRNKTTFASKTNRAPIHALKYSVAVDGNGQGQFQLVKNATVAGSPSWTDISTNTSVVEYDVAGTDVSGGEVIDFSSFAKVDSTSVNPKIFDVFLNPGETLTLAVQTASGTTEATVSIRWIEDV